MAPRTWTAEQRQRQREAIQLWQPWKHSTGPKSAEGKLVASRNAWTGGHLVEFRQLVKEINQALRSQREWVED
jgi:hypothetical protein